MIKIPLAEPDLSSLERQYLLEAYDSGWISKGPFIEKFEACFAHYIGVPYAISTCNGTAALQLAYLACGMGDKEVLVPTDTFIATKNMAYLTSERVIEVNPDTHSWNINLELIKESTGIVVGVHLYGNPIQMDCLPLKQAIFIEDCAQSIGSEFRRKKCGAFGLAAAFSFYGNKTLTTGEGGMVCTSDPKVAERVRSLRNHCMLRPYVHSGIGFNYKMTNLQAAIGLAQLERLDELCAKKQQITRWYDSALSRKFIRQRMTRGAKVVRWMNAYKHEKAEKVRQALEMIGVETRPGFIGSDTIMFPSGTKLTKAQVEMICKEANGVA